MDYRFSCGDLIIPEEHPTAKIIAQRINLTCESMIKKSYYSVDGRELKTVPICIHCGEKGGSDFLFQQAELENKNKTDGRQCYPICELCLNEGKKVVVYGEKKKTNLLRREKRKEDRARANKEAEASKLAQEE